MILVFGALHLDVILRTPAFPQPDETVMGEDVLYAFGGKGGNQAVGAARMGAKVAMAGAVGTDSFADTLRAALRVAGVDDSRVAVKHGASGMSAALVRPDGSYGAVVVSGVNRELEGVEVPGGTRWLLLQNEVPDSANLAAAQSAKAVGAKVLLNAAPARALSPELAALVDVVVVNQVEAEALVPGLPPAEQARKLAERHAAIVTLGGDGLEWAEGLASGRVAAHPVDVRSTHGAGDFFIGALAADLARGAGLAEACRFASAAAALHVSVEHRLNITPEQVRALMG